ncbi:MAG: glycoside hydrolase family 32 protein [Saprospiraceae bacterium]|nr:glycoside hydrolase family 32 protein [Saprospiraceae bacterium]
MKKAILYGIIASIVLITTVTSDAQNKYTFNKNLDGKREQHRPVFHFTPPQNWMNDPNGMVYFEGEYHLFYQHYPDSTVWGPMHWGHAVSKDLMNWAHLPIALYPDKLGYIFSGSAVVDKKNTSGFGKKGQTPLVAIFTYHDMVSEKAGNINFQTQGIAYSLDKGRNWTKYAQNPVVNNPNLRDFRDPKVIWYEPTQNWVMTLAAGDHVAFYSSKNLKNWEKTGEFGKNEGTHGGVWECPDLFPMTVEGTNKVKWVLVVSINPGSVNGGSGTQYFTGTFDGKFFSNDNKPNTTLWLDYGRDNYAGVTWFGAPNNRRLFLGWMSNWSYATRVPTTKWRSALTLPRDLVLKNTAKGLRIFQNPVKEQKILRGVSQKLTIQNMGEPLQLNPKTPCAELSLTFDVEKSSGDIEIEVRNAQKERLIVGYEKARNQFFIDRNEAGKKDFEKGFAGRHYAPRISTDSILTLNIHLDVASIELFADGGVTTMTDIFFPNEDFTQLIIGNKKGVYLVDGTMWALK